ncbi:MAG: peptide chain release factor N(5)-glutamine methyltransferase, partial [Dehalococcoidales bacterium]|nr:peptide chain release factor N(5)-glutamine methyltransferase [Dehalococcoidales bacterium]
MTIRAALSEGAALLHQGGIDEPRLVAEVLLAHALDLDRARLYARMDQPLGQEALRRWQEVLARALQHEPVAYITGHREFYGLDLYVDGNVLIPRPETETLVEEALAWSRAFVARAGSPPTIVDVGTGSGAIAVSLAVHLPGTTVYAVDISADALRVAKRNAHQHGVTDQVVFLHGDLLAPLVHHVDLICANLPYLTEEEMRRLPPHIAKHEPGEALAAGIDGLDVYRALLAQPHAKL